MADKPGSVVDSHSSRAHVTACLKQPTRERCGPHHSSPIRSCSGRGFPCRECCHPRGALLPHHFTLTGTVRRLTVLRRYLFCGTFRGLAPPRRYLAPCPLEPGLSSACCGGCLANSTNGLYAACEDKSVRLFFTAVRAGPDPIGLPEAALIKPVLLCPRNPGSQGRCLSRRQF